jgi:hypothetical protein
MEARRVFLQHRKIIIDLPCGEGFSNNAGLTLKTLRVPLTKGIISAIRVTDFGEQK